MSCRTSGIYKFKDLLFPHMLTTVQVCGQPASYHVPPQQFPFFSISGQQKGKYYNLALSRQESYLHIFPLQSEYLLLSLSTICMSVCSISKFLSIWIDLKCGKPFVHIQSKTIQYCNHQDKVWPHKISTITTQNKTIYSQNMMAVANNL
jgi:hypothetical protein